MGWQARQKCASVNVVAVEWRNPGAHMKLLLVWLIHAIALMAVAHLVPGIAVSSFVEALFAVLILGLVNAVIRPLLILV
jgi:hypothetical protein